MKIMIDSEILLYKLLGVENLAKGALDRTDIIAKVTLQDLEVIRETATNLITLIRLKKTQQTQKGSPNTKELINPSDCSMPLYFE